MTREVMLTSNMYAVNKPKKTFHNKRKKPTRAHKLQIYLKITFVLFLKLSGKLRAESYYFPHNVIVDKIFSIDEGVFQASISLYSTNFLCPRKIQTSTRRLSIQIYLSVSYARSIRRNLLVFLDALFISLLLTFVEFLSFILRKSFWPRKLALLNLLTVQQLCLDIQ